VEIEKTFLVLNSNDNDTVEMSDVRLIFPLPAICGGTNCTAVMGHAIYRMGLLSLLLSGILMAQICRPIRMTGRIASCHVTIPGLT